MTHPPLPDFDDPRLRVQRATPAWFDWALAQPFTSRYVTVEDCPIHYMLWPGESERWRRTLEASGHFVVFVDASELKERTHA